MGSSDLTIALGHEHGARGQAAAEKSGIEYRVFDSICGLARLDRLMQTLSEVSGMPMPPQYERQRKVLVDAMRDAHLLFRRQEDLYCP